MRRHRLIAKAVAFERAQENGSPKTCGPHVVYYRGVDKGDHWLPHYLISRARRSAQPCLLGTTLRMHWPLGNQRK
jgi:hypothetical protein